MHAQRLKLIVFSVITILATFLPWISFNAKISKLVKGADVESGIKYFFLGLAIIVIVLAVTGDKSKAIGWIKKIAIALFAIIIAGLGAKYLGDASSEISSPGLGLYLLEFGGIMILIMAFLPADLLPCVLHKFIGKPE